MIIYLYTIIHIHILQYFFSICVYMCACTCMTVYICMCMYTCIFMTVYMHKCVFTMEDERKFFSTSLSLKISCNFFGHNVREKKSKPKKKKKKKR